VWNHCQYLYVPVDIACGMHILLHMVSRGTVTCQTPCGKTVSVIRIWDICDVNIIDGRFNLNIYIYIYIKVKVKQSRYRPGVA